LHSVLRELGKREVTSVLIEGGGEILGAAHDENLIDKVQLYFAPLLAGGGVPAFGGRGAKMNRDGLRLKEIEYRKIDGDVCLCGYIQSAPKLLTPAAV
jgi:diaminohydroxyphosphoribosylaminopyrimidine deaminase/5-amino-6-(5-phosphoribosylamino)uracil reductase